MAGRPLRCYSDTTRGGRPSTSYRGLDHEEPSGSEASDDDEL